ncbi:unnamed protein product [Chilo suppressalis]|uniref:FAD-binding PCMH-type domain-containing protein n=1 Tax=Chilo suppressalis TaxID=168631 RepID=A0ABN8AVG9_CHISP|nr:unnamed protein product [Chilo suppressalis]
MARIKFTVNGITCSVGNEISSDVMLLDYLRKYLQLRGTKYMCREGGCGACIVTAVKSPGETPIAVNSCLVSVASCYDWDITTVEKVGNRKDGYNQIQTNLAKENGTQCGYCTPGWVMAMYSLMQNKKNLTMLEIEQSFGSNICRCTGYRSIMDAFKKFATDYEESSVTSDIEDLSICRKSGSCSNRRKCSENEWCFVTNDVSNIIEIELKDGTLWYRVSTIGDIFEVLNSKPNDSYMLVAGNTAKGAYPIDSYPKVMIDITGVSEFKGWNLDQNLVVGAGTTLTELSNICSAISKEDNFAYLKVFEDHIKLVAHIPVKNIGTIAGNLMIKHQHNDFTSDIFLLFETVGAVLTIQNNQNQVQMVSMADFLKLDMNRKVIVKASLQPYNDKDCKFVSYKVMPRSQNVHAMVNAGFFYKLKQPDNIVESCKIVYSGLSPPFTRGSATENNLIGKQLFTNETLQKAVKILNSEIVVVDNPPEESSEYRKILALGLFYKSILFLCPTQTLDAQYRSGATKIHETRPVSKGQQIFDTNPLVWPLNQSLEKVEALRQCSGEVLYTEDLPSFPFEVFAAFVLSTECSGNIVNIDPTDAMKIPGVLQFYKAEDIPGINSFTDIPNPLFPKNEEVLCSGAIKYFNQPLGIIVAETQYLADKAVKLVKVTYSNVKKPIIDINEAKKDPARVTQFAAIPAVIRGIDIAKIFKGGSTIYWQYHFPMETLVCVVRPSEDGLEVHNSTQWMDATQAAISKALKMDANSIDVYVRRLGGSYGYKVSRALQVAVACSLVAKKLNRPCRFIQPLTTNIRAIGKRFPCSTEYEVAVNRSGVIQYVDYQLYEDNGYMINEALYLVALEAYGNLYKKTRFSFKGSNVVTDTPKNTWCRAPGTMECISMAEMLMERISYEVSVDPIDVRLANLDTILHSDIKEMVETLKTNSEYKNRKTAVEEFNKTNRWKKRGLRVSMMSYFNTPAGLRLDVNLSVYNTDGTVVITHSGIEMGQGINTKAVQIAAFFLKIPVSKIKVKANDTIIGPNADVTGGSITSQCISIGVQRCCEELLKRLAPIKLLKPLAPWEELIRTAYLLQVDLQTHGFVSTLDGQIFYNYGVCLAEVELDILTGESEILRVDLIEDAGQSVNPALDIGQIEGAFTMGLGYWTIEKLEHNPENGEILTDRTWNYHVPQCRDIPQDFRVYLRKNSYSNIKILGTKATAEPPICLSVCVPFALRHAVTSTRLNSGIPTTSWFPIDGPYTAAKLCLASATKIEHFKLY